MNTENNLLEELHELNDRKVQTEHVENISGSQLEPQNGFQENSIDPSTVTVTIPETGIQIPHIQIENGLAKPSSKEPNTKEISDVGLSIHSV